MVYALIGSGAALLLVLALFAVGRKGFHQAFGRQTEVPLDHLDLSKTHYAPYEKALRSGIERYRRLPWQTLTLTARDGVRLVGRCCVRDGHRTAVLVHGYHAVPENNFPIMASRLWEEGYSLFVPILRAHGESGGDYCTFGALEAEDLLDWLALLQQRDPAQRFYLYGVSMGAYTTACCGPRLEQFPVRAVVLDCGFTGAYAEVRHKTPPLPPPLRSLVCFSIWLYAKLFHGFDLKKGDALKPLSQTTLPVFVLHGRADRIVPFENGPRMLAAAGGPKQYRFLDGTDHNECVLSGGPALEQEIVQFFNSNV